MIISEVGSRQKTYLESVKLNICVSMGEALDHTLHSFLGTMLITRYLVAHLDDGTPVLRSEVLVCGLGYRNSHS